MRAILAGASFAAAVTAILVVKSGDHRDAEAAPTATVYETFRRSCVGARDPQCPILHAAVVAYTINAIEALIDMGESGAAYNLELQALALDEPQLQLFAAQALNGSHGDDVTAAVIPLLLGPHPALHAPAAEIVAGNFKTQGIGERYKLGHATPPKIPLDPFAGLAELPAVAAKFPAYPNAVRYAPGDSSHSIGFRTPDALDKVIAFYAKSGAKLDAKAWTSGPKSESEANAKELQQLSEEFQRTHDMKLVQRMQELGNKIQASSQREMNDAKQRANNDKAVASRKPPSGDAGKTFVGVVVEGDAGNPIRAVAIYREEYLKLTIVEYVWNADKYPVWP